MRVLLLVVVLAGLLLTGCRGNSSGGLPGATKQMDPAFLSRECIDALPAQMRFSKREEVPQWLESNPEVFILGYTKMSMGAGTYVYVLTYCTPLGAPTSCPSGKGSSL